MSARRSLIRSLATLSAAALLGTAGVAASAQTLTVSAAASLTQVLKAIGAQYEATRPGVKLQFNFAASGVLIQQIAQGAPVDVFISADEETMARGIAQKLLDATSRRDIASNQLVLIVPKEAVGAPVTTLADLGGNGVRRIALGKPASVPAGRYTRQALDTARLWPALEAKAVYADSVRQVLDYVARGEVEAGFVYATDAAVMPDKVRTVQRIDGHDPVRYPAALTTEGRQKAAAGDFLAFLLAPAAQDVLAKAGFGKP